MSDGEKWVDEVIFESTEDLELFEKSSQEPSTVALDFYLYINLSTKKGKLLKLNMEKEFQKISIY